MLLAAVVAGSTVFSGCERHDTSPVQPEPPRTATATAAPPPTPTTTGTPHTPVPTPGGLAAPPWPAELAGGAHHKDAADEINLVLEPDGTFRWNISGCDFDSGDCGRWVPGERGAVVLLPDRGRKTFTWCDDVSFNNPVSQVVVRAGKATGTWSVVASRADKKERLEQTWKPGRVCKLCERPAPAPIEACSDPVPPCGAR